jgi:hypothetical protein
MCIGLLGSLVSLKIYKFKQNINYMSQKLSHRKDVFNSIDFVIYKLYFVNSTYGQPFLSNCIFSLKWGSPAMHMAFI